MSLPAEKRTRKRPANTVPSQGRMDRSLDLLQHWIRAMARHLLSLKPENQACLEDDDHKQHFMRLWKRKKKIVLTACATLAAVYLYRCARKRSGKGMYLLALLMGGWNRQESSLEDYRSATEAPLSILWNAAKLGQVRRALLLGSQSAIAYQLEIEGTSAWKKSTLPPNLPSLQSDLLESLSQNGCTDVSALPESIWSRLATPAMAALPFVYLAFLYRMMRNLNGDNDNARTYEEASRTTSFADVAGLDHAVTEVSDVVSYLANPTSYHGLGARPPNAVLLYGPPGSGKTLLARAVAGEGHCNTFVACSGSDFVDTYVGRGASRVRKLFDSARRQARGQGGSWWTSLSVTSQPPPKVASALIFIDEVDALARSRGVFANNDERDNTLNQLLTEMDGFDQHPDVTLIVIAATNRADVLDPAILRRFDRQVHVGYPDAAGREAILLINAKRIQCRLDEIDWTRLAILTDNFSGADLRNVTNDAALLAVRDGNPAVCWQHLEHAVERVREMKSTKSGSLNNPPPHLPGILLRR